MQESGGGKLDHETLQRQYKCEEKLGNLEDATFEDFVLCRGDELTSFLFVRDPYNFCEKVADAKAGVDILILHAFSAQTEPIFLQDPTQEEQATKQDATSEPVPIHRAVEIINVQTNSPGWSCNKQVSALLNNKDWISAVKFCCDPQGKLMQAESMVTEELNTRTVSSGATYYSIGKSCLLPNQR
jgi:hypothetical protein